MRIIAGKYKGKNLAEFDGQAVRPTSDRAREALFSSLQFEICGKTFLDAFCGSGAVGIEALSRGAKEVVFTDVSKTSCELTLKNLRSVKENARPIFTDAKEYLARTDKRFDIIFLDPPYKSNEIVPCLEIIAKRKILNDGGVVVVEAATVVNRLIEGLFVEKTRKYGAATFTYFRKTRENVCVFAGSFDPVTKGHEQIVQAALKKYEKVIVALGVNEQKTCTFTRSERLDMLNIAFSDVAGVTVTEFDGLLVDFLRQNRVINNVRGIRNDADFAYEQNMYEYNKKLMPEIKNDYIKGDFANISSTAARAALENGEGAEEYLSERVLPVAKKYFLAKK